MRIGRVRWRSMREGRANGWAAGHGAWIPYERAEWWAELACEHAGPGTHWVEEGMGADATQKQNGSERRE